MTARTRLTAGKVLIRVKAVYKVHSGMSLASDGKCETLKQISIPQTVLREISGDPDCSHKTGGFVLELVFLIRTCLQLYIHRRRST